MKTTNRFGATLVALVATCALTAGCASASLGGSGGSPTETAEPVPATSPETPKEFIDKATWVESHPHPRGRYSDKFPDILLTDQDGQEHRFYADLVRDRVVLVQFFYTTCRGI